MATYILSDNTGSRFEFQGPAGPEGKLEYVFHVAPGLPKQPPHLHPAQREVFRIRSGRLRVLCGQTWKDLAAGDEQVITARTLHSICNPHAEWTEIGGELEPARNWLGFWAVLTELTKTYKGPGFVLRLARLIRRHPEEVRFRAPIRIVLAIAAGLGRALRLELPDAEAILRRSEQASSGSG